ncbi:MAG TPA: hypothetical protein VI434_04250 [Candidatus Dormibacteraeota bacterium]
MEDDDIRQLLHSTYSVDRAPTVVRGALARHPRGPRRSGLVTALIAAAVIIVVAVPIGAGVLLRTGVIGGSSASPMHVFDLKMYGTSQGWAWSGGNNILHTNSGVQHWAIVPPPIGGQLITGVAWAGADSARILTAPADSLNELERTYTLTPWVTDDGGASWMEGEPFRALLETGVDATDGSLYGNLDFVDPLHGWFFNSQGPAIGAPIFIDRTVDGGLHWSQVEMTPATGTAARGALPVGCSPYGMTFLNVTTGWVAGSCGHATLFDVTHDGGMTWTPQPFPCPNCALYPPTFTSSLDGEVFGGSNTYGLFVTSDGGQTWNATASPPPGNWPDFVNANDGFTMGLTGNANPLVVLWTTTDGGNTWREAPNGAIHGSGPVQTSQLDFITPSTGWAVSIPIYMELPDHPIPPQLWGTTDGGSTWALITPTYASAT